MIEEEELLFWFSVLLFFCVSVSQRYFPDEIKLFGVGISLRSKGAEERRVEVLLAYVRYGAQRYFVDVSL